MLLWMHVGGRLWKPLSMVSRNASGRVSNPKERCNWDLREDLIRYDNVIDEENPRRRHTKSINE